MNVNKLICDICGNNLKGRGHIGYKIKKKQFYLDSTYHNMDICDDCMDRMILSIKYMKDLKSIHKNANKNNMSKDTAIIVLSDELRHTNMHLDDADKAEEFYKEMRDMANALEIGIDAIKKDLDS